MAIESGGSWGPKEALGLSAMSKGAGAAKKKSKDGRSKQGFDEQVNLLRLQWGISRDLAEHKSGLESSAASRDYMYKESAASSAHKRGMKAEKKKSKIAKGEREHSFDLMSRASENPRLKSADFSGSKFSFDKPESKPQSSVGASKQFSGGWVAKNPVTGKIEPKKNT
jgi:hypothetical protein